MGTFSLVNKRTENTSIFVVRIFFALTHLLAISSLAQKIFSLESLVFESSGTGHIRIRKSWLGLNRIYQGHKPFRHLQAVQFLTNFQEINILTINQISVGVPIENAVYKSLIRHSHSNGLSFYVAKSFRVEFYRYGRTSNLLVGLWFLWSFFKLRQIIIVFHTVPSRSWLLYEQILFW